MVVTLRIQSSQNWAGFPSCQTVDLVIRNCMNPLIRHLKSGPAVYYGSKPNNGIIGICCVSVFSVFAGL